MREAAAELTVSHEHGLHLRPAADFVRLAARFKEADVRVSNLTRASQRKANGKSLLELTALGINQGHLVRIAASGEEAEAAVEALRQLVEGGF